MSGLVKLADLLTLEIDDIEVQIIPDGKGSFVVIADGLAKALEYASTAKLTRNISDKYKGGHIVDTLGGPQRKTTITEAGLWEALGRSRADRAKPIQRRMYEEIMPQILRTGGYAPLPPSREERVAAALLDANEIIAESRKRLAAAEQRAEKAEQIVEDTREDAEFGALLKVQPGELRLDAIFSELGLYQGRSPNSTRQWMRDQKHIVRRDGVEMPAARHADAGRFFVRTRKHRRPHEDEDRTHTVIVGTPAGKAWLVQEAPDRCWKPGRGPNRGQMVIK